VLQGDVVDLVALVEALEGFESADLTSTGGGVEEIGLHPEDLHEGRGGL
jgi:hypothetical protein